MTVADFTSDFLWAAAIADTLGRVIFVRRGGRFANVRVEAWHDSLAGAVAAG